MKKLKFLVFAGIVLVALGMTACVSNSALKKMSKLDLSTLDPSNPIQVGAIALSINAETNADPFYAKYGESLRNPHVDLEEADMDKLLEILCGTVAGNWELITRQVKAKTGLTLDGDQLLEDWENRDSSRIHSQDLNPERILFALDGYHYSWDNPEARDHSLGNYSLAIIWLMFSSVRESLELNVVTIETGDKDAFDEVTNVRQAKISLR